MGPVGLLGEIQVVGRPSAGERGVGELATERGVGKQEGGVGGEALGDVAGERVAVLGAVGLPRWCRAGSRASSTWRVDLDCQPLVLGVDVNDVAAVAVGDAVLVVVALDEDEVAGGERAAGNSSQASEAPGRLRLVSGELVEVGDVGSAVSGMIASSPVCALHQSSTSRVRVWWRWGRCGCGRAAGGDCLGGPTVGDMIERAAFHASAWRWL